MTDCVNCRPKGRKPKSRPSTSGPGPGEWIICRGHWVYVELNSEMSYVGVTGRHGEDIFFVQGEEADEWLKMTPKEVCEALDSSGMWDARRHRWER